MRVVVASILASCILCTEGAVATDEAPESYVDTIGSVAASDDGNTIAMIAIPGGEFTMGSPFDEAKRRADEGPERQVRVDGFWIGQYEVTWRQFRPFLNEGLDSSDSANDKNVDAITRPSPINWHVNVLNIGMDDDQPVAGITQYAAKQYCRWLSQQTGHYYRLPTEAEWEFACRAGTTTAYSFGEDVEQLTEHAWFAKNAYNTRGEGYRPIGQKKPNAWGLYDMHGNVAEWVLDGYQSDAFEQTAKQVVDPYVAPSGLYPRVARGGSWMDEPDRLRSAARTASRREWKDPSPAPSLWYLRSGEFVGFRVARPFAEPTDADRKRSAPDRFQD